MHETRFAELTNWTVEHIPANKSGVTIIKEIGPFPSANLLKNPILKEWKAELNFVLFFRAGFPNNI